MAPNKGKSRAHYTQPQPSDYETDAPQMDHPAPLPVRSTEELNLSAIRRHYPDVTSIQHVVHYAVLYTFSLEESRWEKAGVEGTLFICELVPSAAGAERYGVVMLNRRSLDNFYMEIVGPDGIELTDEYIIMQGDEVYGLWIFNEPNSSTAGMMTQTAAKIQELAARVEVSKAAAAQNTDTASVASDQVQSSVPMGRQLSLRELFGQQRTQDAAWSVVNHHNAHAGTPPQNSQPDMLAQLFMRAKQDYNNPG
ncbi:PH domain-like protein [Bimuria novae-zelandiae CBS 107.79]|uniref:PH domain-like protein n=1 Tax=Bimuria novae-zelandiae CBS 107.79 TaxID=1447943 RepID=A0A6A5VDU3_9PLEO|nr:PH domain-like protein [Bimuria novae-zelandiae CBS 107.79]